MLGASFRKPKHSENTIPRRFKHKILEAAGFHIDIGQ